MQYTISIQTQGNVCHKREVKIVNDSWKLVFSREFKTLSGIGGDIPFESIRLIVFIIGCSLFYP